MKKLISLLALVALTVGCQSTAVTKAFVKNTVRLGVAFGIDNAPEAEAYLRYAAPVICEAAKGTNVQPASVIATLEANAQARAAKNLQAVLIFDTVFGIYTSLFEEYGAQEVQNRALLQSWLQGTCEGILAGLPTPGVTTSARRMALPPHLRFP